MDQFEYKEINLQGQTYKDPKRGPIQLTSEQVLNQLGEDGWELVETLPTGISRLKRKKTAPARKSK